MEVELLSAPNAQPSEARSERTKAAVHAAGQGVLLRLFAQPYSEEVYDALDGRRTFYLSQAPPGGYLWQDYRYAVLALPIPPL